MIILVLLGAAAIAGGAWIVARFVIDNNFPPSAGKLGGDKGLRPPR